MHHQRSSYSPKYNFETFFIDIFNLCTGLCVSVRTKPLFWFTSDTKTTFQRENLFADISMGFFSIIKGPLKPDLLADFKYF